MAIPNTPSKSVLNPQVEMVSKEMIDKMAAYAKKLRLEHSTWKPEKIAKKVCQKFKVTPI